MCWGQHTTTARVSRPSLYLASNNVDRLPSPLAIANALRCVRSDLDVADHNDLDLKKSKRKISKLNYLKINHILISRSMPLQTDVHSTEHATSSRNRPYFLILHFVVEIPFCCGDFYMVLCTLQTDQHRAHHQ